MINIQTLSLIDDGLFYLPVRTLSTHESIPTSTQSKATRVVEHSMVRFVESR